MKEGQSRKEIEKELDGQDIYSKFSSFYIFKEVLGQGAFGKVIHALCKETKQDIAVKVNQILIHTKIIEKGNVNEYEIDKLKGEASILKSLDHPNIVKFKHVSRIYS